MNYAGSVYLAGPMRGLPEFNFPAFHEAAAELRERGFAVWSPAEADMELDGFDPSRDVPLELRDYMVRDLPAVCSSDFVVVLPGWETSQGAQLEVHVARTCGIPVVRYPDLERVDDPPGELAEPAMRKFETGATRNVDATEPDFEGFLSPLALLAFADYMHRHRVQADGSLRDSDNWQKGIPLDSYMKSGFRHFMDWWLEHRDYTSREGLGDALCGLLFNVQGYLHEIVKEELEARVSRAAAEGSSAA